MLAWLRAAGRPGRLGRRGARAVAAADRAALGGHRAAHPARAPAQARHGRRGGGRARGAAALARGPRPRARVPAPLPRRVGARSRRCAPDAFVHRLIERIGLRRQQVFAAQADTVERLRQHRQARRAGRRLHAPRAAGHARATSPATWRRSPRPGCARRRRAAAAADAAVRVMTMHAAKGLEFDHVFVLGLSAARDARAAAPRADDGVPDELLKERLPAGRPRARTRREMRRAAARGDDARAQGARAGLGRAGRAGRHAAAVALLRGGARGARASRRSCFEEELFGPAEGLHSTFRIMRDELLDTVARVGGRLGGDAARHLPRRRPGGGPLPRAAQGGGADRARQARASRSTTALPEVNELLAPGRDARAARDLRRTRRSTTTCATPSATSAAARRRSANGSEPSLEPFIPRRGDGLMLSASDIETYRLCPLKYKFARVFRIPQEPTINQRFGIVVHQVLERFHTRAAARSSELMELFEASWRRCGLRRLGRRPAVPRAAVAALERYWELDRDARRRAGLVRALASPSSSARTCCAGASTASTACPDGTLRADRLQDRQGRRPSERAARGHAAVASTRWARASRGGSRPRRRATTTCSTARRCRSSTPTRSSTACARTVAEIADGILRQDFEPTPVARDLRVLRLPDHLPGGREVADARRSG